MPGTSPTSSGLKTSREQSFQEERVLRKAIAIMRSEFGRTGLDGRQQCIHARDLFSELRTIGLMVENCLRNAV
jgi:hypothetical protein